LLDANLAEKASGGSSSNASSETSGNDSGNVDATERARERAQELGVDISTVEGSGTNGRVTVEDVEKAADSDNNA
jgi:pyruvate/2-oxoglutarate dehydrogenase complex dihydrolipoamide acyltransferase (E2) component